LKKCISISLLLLLMVMPRILTATNRVDKIDFEGNKNVSKKQLYGVIKYNKKRIYNFENLTKFKEEILQYYKNNGYFDVGIKYELTKKNGKNIIIFKIDEGEVYKIKEITVEGNTVVKDNKIINLISIKKNSAANINKIKSGELNVGKYYSNIGYLYANVFTKINVIGKASIGLKIIIDEGPKVYIKSIELKNVGKINKNTILREIRVKKGEPCSYGKLIESQSKVFGTGLFSDVHFSIEGIQEKNDSVSVIFYLVPAKTHWIFAGLSYETPDIMALTGEWGFNNLFNLNNWIKFNGKIAYSYHSGYLYHMKADYLNPYFIFRELSFKISADYYNENYYDYIEKTRYLEISLGKQWLNNNFISINVNIQNSAYDSIINGLKKPLIVSYTNSAFIDINRDYTDNFIFPKTGYRYYLKLQYSGGILHGSNNFYKGYLSFSIVKSLKNTIFSVKTQFGIIVPFANTDASNISFDQMYKLGGAYNMRGYNENSLGITDIYNNYGGLNLTCSNFEVTSPSFRNFSISTFFDIGRLNNNIKLLIPFEDYKTDAGIGLRYITPIGPVRLDWAYPFDGSSKWGKIYLAIGTIY